MVQAVCTLAAGTNYKVDVTAGGHSVVSDQAVSVGGTGAGPTPKELLLAAIGACTVQTLMMVAPQRKWDIKSLVVKVTFSEIPDPADASKKISLIEELIEVTGNLSQAELDAIERTAGRCPVLKAVEGPKQVTKKAVKV
ncbi:MAG TPA: OsmC family protein [Candidatus Obscuribacter sp.]|nr:OsmC family protein [Candidatus Obscuribacter sp.]MBK9277797.1 OsmC family protein [Candidatus Obscuribacter sp.]HMW89513.1 OsmC family protein [Candidatus Obscuribacter sp.]HMY05008.1 OsmC family protein [Candidatus Obscuribacter sp.]HMY53900.1 OsmC family protein [Candidatus Obscuribacter sp.]